MAEDETHVIGTQSVQFGRAIPILRVANLDASLDYYFRALGFKLQWRDRGFASVHRDEASLMLCEGDQGQCGTWLWFPVGDVDALHDELRMRGASIRHAPANYPWGSRELQVSDPDGHVLRLATDVKPGEPIGDWLDGSGVRWIHQPDGSWRAANDHAR
jgi:uncharacterized glyoxalase superfamily protein PhnB